MYMHLSISDMNVHADHMNLAEHHFQQGMSHFRAAQASQSQLKAHHDELLEKNNQSEACVRYLGRQLDLADNQNERMNILNRGR